MGQVQGIPKPPANIERFLNLSKDALESLWASYNILGEGWGLSIDDLNTVLYGAEILVAYTKFTKDQVEMLFRAFDTDRNDLIDALEMLVTISLLSGIDTVEKIQFAFCLYDFDSRGSISYDETSLLLRSVTNGCAKAFPSQAAFTSLTSGQVENYAHILFSSLRKSQEDRVSSAEFQSYCIAHPVITSWLRYVSALPANIQDILIEERDDKLNPVHQQLSINKAAHPALQAITLTSDDFLDLETRRKEAAEESISLSSDLTWFASADLSKPEELPPLRVDAPQDIFEPTWVHGINTSLKSHPAVYDSSSSSSSSTTIVYTSGRHVLSLSKSEEGWSQKISTEHNFKIQFFVIADNGKLFVTAENYEIIQNSSETPPKKVLLNVWDASTTTVSSCISLAADSQITALDLSRDGKYLLVLQANTSNIATIFEVKTKKIVFQTSLAVGSVINDAKFALTSSIFAVATAKGINFYFEDGSGSIGGINGLKYFEKRPALCHFAGTSAEGKACTTLSRFMYADEFISGTEDGHVMLWRGRSLTQSLNAHSGSVTSIHYNRDSKLVVTAGADGKILLLQIELSVKGAPNSPRNFNPSSPKRNSSGAVRSLAIVCVVSTAQHSIVAASLRSAVLAHDCTKLVVTTTTGTLIELSCADYNDTKHKAHGFGFSLSSSLDAADTDGGEPNTNEEGGEVKLKLGDALNGGPLITGHSSSSQVTSLCKTPGGFISCGNDCTVQVWAAAEGTPQKNLKSITLDSGCQRVVSSSAFIAVLLDGAINSTRKGIVQIFTLPDLKFVADLNDCAESDVLDLKFTPDGNTLVLSGARESHFFVYTAVEGVWSLKLKFPTASPGYRFDISTDGLYLRSQALSFELFVYDLTVNVGDIVKNSEVLKGVTWASSTCLYSWDTKGLFNNITAIGDEVAEVTCSDRCNHLYLLGRRDGSFTASRVPAYKYSKSSSNGLTRPNVTVKAHTGPLSSLVFIEEGARLVTTGLTDGVITVWKTTYDTEEPELEPEPTDDAAVDEEKVEDPEEEIDGRPALAKVFDDGEDEDLIDYNQCKSHLTQCETLKDKWETLDFVADLDIQRSTLSENTSSIKNSSLINKTSATSYASPHELRIQWIHGYSSRTTRSSVKYNLDGNIVYPASTFAVIFSKIQGKQVLSATHFDEVSCLDVHIAQNIATSACIGVGDTFINVWNASTGVTITRLDCGHVNGISAIAFSPCGHYIVAACQDLFHTVKLFDWRNNLLRSEAIGGDKKILNITFSADSGGKMFRILQGGIGHFTLLNISTSGAVTAKVGGYGQGVKKANVLCAVALPMPTGAAMSAGINEFVLGFANGSIAAISKGEYKVSGFTPVQAGAITAIAVVTLKASTAEEPAVYKVVTAGVNGAIRILDQEFQPLNVFNLYYPPLDPDALGYQLNQMGRARGFKSICVDRLNRKILYGTTAGEIGEIDFETGADVNAGPLVQSHFKGELHALVVHPLRQECLTGGDDKTIKVWDLNTNKLVNQIDLPDVIRSLVILSNGLMIAAAIGHPSSVNNAGETIHGKTVIVSYMQGVLRIIYSFEDAKLAVSSLAFTPNGNKLFCGSRDSKIYVYDAWDNFKFVKTLSDHSQPVVALDITKDGNKMVSHGEHGEIRIWNTNNYGRISEDILKIVLHSDWYSRQGIYGLDCIGVYEPYRKATDVLSLSQAKELSLLVTGDVSGNVKLFSYPTPTLGSPYKLLRGHSPGGVSRLEFTFENKLLVSIGRHDKSLIVWEIIKSDVPPDETKISPLKKPSDEMSPPTEASHAFASSFNVKGVDFSKGNSHHSTASAVYSSSTVSTLSNVVGVGRKAFYCGVGDTITSFGKITGVLSRGKSSVKSFSMANNSGIIDYSTSAGEIGAIAVSTCAKFLAVGSSYPTASSNYLELKQTFLGRLVVVNASTYEIISLLDEDISGGVITAAFSVDSCKLACLSGDFGHTLRLFVCFNNDWSTAILLYSGYSSAGDVSLVSFLSYEPHVTGDDSDNTGSSNQGDAKAPPDIVIAGHNTIKFWSIQGKNLVGDVGIYEKETKGTSYTALTAIPYTGHLITGDKDGNLWLWHGSTMLRQLGSHASVVSSLTSFSTEIPSHSSLTFSSTLSKSLKSTLSTPFEPSSSADIKDEKSLTSVLTSSARKLSRNLIRMAAAIKPNVGFLSASCDNIKIWSADTWTAYRELNLSDIFTSSPTNSSYITCMSVDPNCTRLLISSSGSSSNGTVSVISEVAVDSGANSIIRIGETRQVKLIAAHPVNENLLTVTTDDNVVSIWNIAPKFGIIIGHVQIPHTVTAVKFYSETCIAIAASGSDTGGNAGTIIFADLTDTSLEPEEMRTAFNVPSYTDITSIHIKISHRIHNVGTGNIRHLAVSPTKALICACSNDGFVYLFENNQQVPVPITFQELGGLKGYAANVPVASADFSKCSKYLRIFGECYPGDKIVNVDFFDLSNKSAIAPAVKISSTSELTNIRDKIQWSSISSPASPEARGVYTSTVKSGVTSITGMSSSIDGQLIAVGYNDASVKVFRSSEISLSTEILVHGGASDVVLTAFLGSGNAKLCTYGSEDKCFMIWDINQK